MRKLKPRVLKCVSMPVNSCLRQTRVRFLLSVSHSHWKRKIVALQWPQAQKIKATSRPSNGQTEFSRLIVGPGWLSKLWALKSDWNNRTRILSNSVNAFEPSIDKRQTAQYNKNPITYFWRLNIWIIKIILTNVYPLSFYFRTIFYLCVIDHLPYICLVFIFKIISKKTRTYYSNINELSQTTHTTCDAKLN